MIIKVLHEQKMIGAIKKYVGSAIGDKFTESPPFDLGGAFVDSMNSTPIIFVLSPGADPISYLLNLAEQKGMKDKLKIISLGQGQGPIASKLIE